MMSRAMTVRVDESTKRQADEILGELGLNMTTYVQSSLKALIREKGVPFELSTKEKANADYLAKLDNSLDDYLENGGYEFDLKTGTFSDTLTGAKS